MGGVCVWVGECTRARRACVSLCLLEADTNSSKVKASHEKSSSYTIATALEVTFQINPDLLFDLKFKLHRVPI